MVIEVVLALTYSPVRNPSYIYAHSYQSKVLIAGTFTALPLMVIAKMWKLSFWYCCECYSCVCCDILFSRCPDWPLWWALWEAKDSLLSTFEKSYTESIMLFDLKRAQSHEGWCSEVSLPKKKRFKMILHQCASPFEARFKVSIFTGTHKQLTLCLHQAVWPVPILLRM